MQPPPRASLVITTFNRRTSVLRAIESARRQTVQNLDIVVVDDASTDGTAEAVAGISDHRLRYVRLAENSGGPSRPANVGVHHAAADIVMFLDSDDALRPDYVAHVLPAFDDPRVGMAWAQKAIYKQGTLTYVAYVNPFREMKEVTLLPTMLEWTPGTGGMALRREVIARVGGFDESIQLDDLEFCMRFAIDGGWAIRVVPEILYDVNVSPGSASSSASEGYVASLHRLIEKHRTVLESYPAVLARYQYRLARCCFDRGDEQRGRNYLRQSMETAPSFWRPRAYGWTRRARLLELWRLGARLRAWRDAAPRVRRALKDAV